MYLSVRGGGRVRAGKVLGIVGNYAMHRAEMGHAGSNGSARSSGNGRAPSFFLKPTSSLLPGGGDILLPRDVGRVEHEVELAVVIDRRARNVAPEEAMDYVLGYAVFLDITARDLQAEAKKAGLPWDEAKGFDTFGPVSEVVRRSQVGDPHDLELRLTVNGLPRQAGSTKQMMVQVPQLIARLSRAMTLEHGDIIATGTPEGVGPIAPGDVVEAELGNLVRLHCRAVEG